MYRLLLYEYIKKIKKEDIYNFAKTQNIILTSEEINLIYKYITNDYKRILDNPEEILKEVKGKIRINLYNKLEELYSEYAKYLN